MLKIANVKWKGRCGTHPMYDPFEDGEAGIRGACKRCYALLAIAEQHRALMRALKDFGAAGEERRRRVAARQESLQQMLF